MNQTVLSDRDRLQCMIALVAALSVVSTSSSLTWPILAESLRNQGYNETMIGLNAAAQFSGIIVVAMIATTIIPKLGFYRVAMLGLGIVAITLLLLPTWRDYEVWFVMRFALGVGNSLLFTAGDTWINQIVDDRVRGRWMGIYSTVGMAGWAVGPLVGSSMDPETYGPFLVGIAAICIAVTLLWPARRIDVVFDAPLTGPKVGNKLWIVFLIAPTVLLSSGMFGMVEGALQSFAHLYTMDVLGDTHRKTGYAVIWVGSVGAIFFQYPVGWLADKIDRGWLLVTCVAVMAAMVFCLPLAIHGAVAPTWSLPWLTLWFIVSLWGGAMGATFTVGITLLGERFRGVELIAANAVFTLLFGLGGIIGPFLVGIAMGQFGPIGFPTSLFIVISAYGIFAAYRQASRKRRTVTARSD